MESTADHSALTGLQKVKGGMELWSDVMNLQRTSIMRWRLVGAQVVEKSSLVMGGGAKWKRCENLTQTKGRSSLIAPRYTGAKRRADSTGTRVRFISWSEGGLRVLTGGRGALAARLSSAQNGNPTTPVVSYRTTIFIDPVTI